jgi:hypothetical protein
MPSAIATSAAEHLARGAEAVAEDDQHRERDCE